MKIQSIVLAGALCLASVSFLSAKTYNFSLSTAAVVGNVQLPAGEYKVRVEGDQATFTEENEHKSFTAPVKLETVPEKYDQTAVVTNTQDGTPHIEAIELGGSKTKLDFK
jgi:hypothetical protein